MRIVAILLSVGLAMWAVYTTHRRLPEFSPWWSLTFWVLIAAGFVLGFYLAAWEYNETAHLRVIGYPFRVVVVLSTGREYGGLFYQNNRAALTADVAVGVLVFVLPFRGIQFLAEVRQKNSER